MAAQALDSSPLPASLDQPVFPPWPPHCSLLAKLCFLFLPPEQEAPQTPQGRTPGRDFMAPGPFGIRSWSGGVDPWPPLSPRSSNPSCSPGQLPRGSWVKPPQSPHAPPSLLEECPLPGPRGTGTSSDTHRCLPSPSFSVLAPAQRGPRGDQLLGEAEKLAGR